MKDEEAKEQLTLNMTGDIGLMRDGIVPEEYVEICIFFRTEPSSSWKLFPE